MVHGSPARGPVEIVPYNFAWPERYRAVSERVLAALGGAVLDIEHVGSTAVEGLGAKDVIDIDLTVADPCDEQTYVPALENLGFVLTVREPSFHEHRCLTLANLRTNLHVFGPGCPESIRHRMFRDWLRTHPEDRALYDWRSDRLSPVAGTLWTTTHASSTSSARSTTGSSAPPGCCSHGLAAGSLSGPARPMAASGRS